MADTHLKISGAWKAINNAHVKVSGAWKNVQKIYVKVGGAWKTAWVNLTVTADDVSGSDSDFAACGFVSALGTNTTPSGGTPPYTYAWTKLSSADGNAFAISSATSQNPSWSATRCDADVDNTETWRVTVTDDNGVTASSDINVTLTWTNLT